ncbi:MAG: ABC transporter substrate-binding protein [Chloroflexota bacterium]
MQLRLGVTFHHVFYAPYYVALHRGLFAEQGLELSTTIPGDGRVILAAQMRGDLDVALGGIMRSLVSYDAGERNVPIHFTRLNDRDGFFLIGRSGSFDWPDLLGKRLILFSEAPTPWFVLRALLLERGLDPDQIRPIAGLPAPEAAEAFKAGEADFLQAPAQVAEALAAEGAGVVVREMATEGGPIPYSSYSALRSVLDTQNEALTAFTRAHVATLEWMRAATGEEIWETIEPSFPDADGGVNRWAVERYHRLGVWSSDATIPHASFDRLADLLHRGGLIQTVAPYDACCDDTITRAVLGMATR